MDLHFPTPVIFPLSSLFHLLSHLQTYSHTLFSFVNILLFVDLRSRTNATLYILLPLCNFLYALLASSACWSLIRYNDFPIYVRYIILLQRGLSFSLALFIVFPTAMIPSVHFSLHRPHSSTVLNPRVKFKEFMANECTKYYGAINRVNVELTRLIAREDVSAS
jgi:hypothetical protein